MSSLIFAQAKRIRKLQKSALERAQQHKEDYDFDFDTNTWTKNTAKMEKIENNILNQQIIEWRKLMVISEALTEEWKNFRSTKLENWFFVTIRPRQEIKFVEFYDTVVKYINRAFMIEYKLSFEQKNNEGNGEGFHVHIVCHTKHRSKGECLRDTISTFNKLCDDNCIDVKVTKNPEDIINNYLLEYKSDDDHKAGTKIGDTIWRERLGLKNLYEYRAPGLCDEIGDTNLPKKFSKVLSSSPETEPNRIQPIIIEIE